MKGMTVAQKMRWVAGVIFIVLSGYQLLLTRCIYLYRAYSAGEIKFSVSNITFSLLYALGLAVAAGAAAIWMLASKKVLPSGARRGVVVAVLLAIVFELLSYQDQIFIIQYSLSSWISGIYSNQMYAYFFMIFRMLLMILATFFVTSSKESLDYVDSSKLPATPVSKRGRLPEEQSESVADKNATEAK